MDRRQILTRIAAGGGVLIVVGVLMAAIIPVSARGASCGTAFDPVEFGSRLIQTSVTRACDDATAGMLTGSLVVVGLGVVVAMVAGFMLVPKSVS